MRIRNKIIVSIIIALFMGLTITACGDGKNKDSNDGKTGDAGGIKTFTAFMATAGTEIPSDNRLQNAIANKIGAKAEVTWLTGQTAKERIGVMVAGGEYPDIIDGGDGTMALIEAGALVPLDDYLDKYPNIKNLWSEQQWNLARRDDGHIYTISQFGSVKGPDMKTNLSDEAFWIQKRVLKWAGFPKIKTLEQYFDLIQAYLEANPTTEDGQKNIGFSILCDDWRYFCLENPPAFLAGYPNDGVAIVDPDTKQVSEYDTIPEAKTYFGKLNEMYHKGVIDPETFTISYDQYLSKLSSGRVLGMVDQGWQFLDAETSLKSQGLDDRTYVPLGIVIDENTVDKYFTPSAFNPAGGLGVSVDCKDVEGALKFIDDLLGEEAMILRNWGEEGVDYIVGEDGVFSRTDEQREQEKNQEWVTKNKCPYPFFPGYIGMLPDGKNAVVANEQPGEFFATLNDIDKEILEAYGFQKWTDFLTPVKENSPWFPIYSASNSWTSDNPAAIAKQKMADFKHEWLPKVIMTAPDEFESMWKEYTDTYNAEIDVESFEKQLTEDVAKRLAIANGTEK